MKEYDFIPNEHPDVKQLKAFQRQINFHQIAKKNPLIVEADHRILSLDSQPCFKIIESRQMRKDKQLKKVDLHDGVIAESKLITLKQLDFTR